MNADNPLADWAPTIRAQPCILVIFGATGDLTSRKLLPALYNLAREGQLPSHFACVGVARRPWTNEQFRQEMLDGINQFSRVKPVDPKLWATFQEQLFYYKAEFHEDYAGLARYLQELDSRFGTQGNRVYYLATPPSYFPAIIERLAQIDSGQRVVIEKPFGEDLKSAQELQGQVIRHLDESQIYRIDHYLGKETVQNILFFRFTNALYEAVWNSRYVDHVQITVAEEIGIGSRGAFWEEAGWLRDIVQNHMMQLLALLAMEPPVSLSPEAIRDEKVKVLQAVRHFRMSELDRQLVRGQYGPGYVQGQKVKGYREEANVNPQSSVETYMACKLYVDNWRWEGVPFYLRGGKRLPKRVTEIAITFKQVPEVLFRQHGRVRDSNVLVLRIQPDEGISLKINSKVPGPQGFIQPVKMDFRYGAYYGLTPPEAYERLICDCMLGDSTLFARADEVMASWKLLDPVLQRWKETPPADFPNYEAGSWGPEAAEQLIERDGRAWRTL